MCDETHSLALMYEVMPIGFALENETQFLPVDWGLVQQVEREADSNDTVSVSLKLLTQTTFRGGFRFLVHEPASKMGAEPRAHSSWFDDTVVPLDWQPAAEKMLRHLMFFGFAAVLYVQSQNTGETAPSVLDTSVYSLFYRYERDGTRIYRAFSNAPMRGGVRSTSTSIGNRKPLDVRLFFMSEPDADGRIVSPMHSVLRSLLAVDTLWRNILDADRERTHPAYLYERVGTHSAASSVLRPGTEESLDWAENDALIHEAQVRQTINETDREQESMSIMMARRRNAYTMQRDYDKTARAVVSKPVPLPWEKQKSVPTDRRLAAAPVPQPLPEFTQTMHQLSARISLACGVPISLIGDDAGAGVKAATDGTMLSVLRDNVVAHQRRLSAYLARMYLDVYGDVLEHEFERGVIAAQLATREPLSEEDVGALRRLFRVVVLFRNAPVMTLENVQTLYDMRVVGRDNMQKLALGVFNLPESLALSIEQEREEARTRAEQEAEAERLMGEAKVASGAVGAGSSSSSSTSTTTTASLSRPAEKRRRTGT